VDFELFRPVLTQALRRGDPSKGGRPGFDPVLKFKMLVLQALHGLSLQQTDYLVRDRLSWMRFCGLGPGDTVPDANTLWDFREAPIAAGEIPEAWRDKPAKPRQKDRDGRWTVKFSKAKPKADATPQVDIAIPVFGTKSHISIDRRHGVIRRARTTDAAKSKIRARVEHVFAEQKQRMGLFIRTIGLARAEATITLANMAFNMKRWCWLERTTAPA